MSKEAGRTLNRRFLPLYIAAFCQGFALWYPIERLFMRDIGFDNATIGLAVAVTSIFVLLAETPSGILADRWSRKGVLMLASIFLALCSAVGEISHSVPMYLVAAGLWGIFFAFYSGTYEAVVYDALLEETGKAEKYEHYYGRTQLADGIALAGGSILGGVAGELLGLRSTYFLTIFSALLAIVALVAFKEPKLHKARVADSIQAHILTTLKEVLKKRTLIPVLIVLIIIAILRSFLFEFKQLWLIALAAPVIVFGPTSALVFSSFALGGLAASRLKLHRSFMMAITILTMLFSGVALALLHNTFAVVVAQVLLGTGLIGVGIIFSRFLQDSLPSKVRAGSSSVVSTIGRIIIIPLSLFFGFISKEASVFTAAWLIFGLLVVLAIFAAKTFTGRNKLSTITLGNDETTIEQYNK